MYTQLNLITIGKIKAEAFFKLRLLENEIVGLFETGSPKWRERYIV